MARLVKRFRNNPYEVTIGGETQYICACGLSGTLPFCDGSHKITQDEDASGLYWYDDEEERHVAPNGFPGIRDDAQTENA